MRAASSEVERKAESRAPTGHKLLAKLLEIYETEETESYTTDVEEEEKVYAEATIPFGASDDTEKTAKKQKRQPETLAVRQQPNN